MGKDAGSFKEVYKSYNFSLKGDAKNCLVGLSYSEVYTILYQSVFCYLFLFGYLLLLVFYGLKRFDVTPQKYYRLFDPKALYDFSKNETISSDLNLIERKLVPLEQQRKTSNSELLINTKFNPNADTFHPTKKDGLNPHRQNSNQPNACNTSAVKAFNLNPVLYSFVILYLFTSNTDEKKAFIPSCIKNTFPDTDDNPHSMSSLAPSVNLEDFTFDELESSFPCVSCDTPNLSKLENTAIVPNLNPTAEVFVPKRNKNNLESSLKGNTHSPTDGTYFPTNLLNPNAPTFCPQEFENILTTESSDTPNSLSH